MSDPVDDIFIRKAISVDLPDIVRLFPKDQMGSEDDSPDLPLHPGYIAAFKLIGADPDHRLLVAEQGGAVVGTSPISYSPDLMFHGGWRGGIEAVRVDESLSNRGIGEVMRRSAIEACRERCRHVVQLTSNNARAGAHRFYERLGFAQAISDSR
jgi:GNAT superfamily N-acetyltransferase